MCTKIPFIAFQHQLKYTACNPLVLISYTSYGSKTCTKTLHHSVSSPLIQLLYLHRMHTTRQSNPLSLSTSGTPYLLHRISLIKWSTPPVDDPPVFHSNKALTIPINDTPLSTPLLKIWKPFLFQAFSLLCPSTHADLGTPLSHLGLLVTIPQLEFGDSFLIMLTRLMSL